MARRPSPGYLNGQLGRIVDPGGATTDFSYDASGMARIRTPLAADTVAAVDSSGHPLVDDTAPALAARTKIGYDATFTPPRVLSVIDCPPPSMTATR
ncbi:MAG: hypothetical protein ABR511_06080 [Acidimicrobiales bacterium]